MPVVIDDFEVVAGEEEHEQTGTAGFTNNTTASPTVHDIERVLERQRERCERVWAH